MFVFDWFLDWIYGKVMEFIQTFFTYLSGMGVEIFELSWIQAVVEFFRLFEMCIRDRHTANCVKDIAEVIHT